MARSIARAILPYLVGLFLACGVIQVFLAGLGVFDTPGAFITHREFGYTFGWLTLLILVAALVGRLPRRIVGGAVLLLVLFALQSVFVALRGTLPAVAALHPLNGFAILAISGVLVRATWALRREPAPTPIGTPDLGATRRASEAG